MKAGTISHKYILYKNIFYSLPSIFIQNITDIYHYLFNTVIQFHVKWLLCTDNTKEKLNQCYLVAKVINIFKPFYFISTGRSTCYPTFICY